MFFSSAISSAVLFGICCCHLTTKSLLRHLVCFSYLSFGGRCYTAPSILNLRLLSVLLRLSLSSTSLFVSLSLSLCLCWSRAWFFLPCNLILPLLISHLQFSAVPFIIGIFSFFSVFLLFLSHAVIKLCFSLFSGRSTSSLGLSMFLFLCVLRCRLIHKSIGLTEFSLSPLSFVY